MLWPLPYNFPQLKNFFGNFGQNTIFRENLSLIIYVHKKSTKKKKGKIAIQNDK